MTGLGWTGRLVLIGVPFLWLALFFLLPLLIVVKISLAESTIGIPPYTPLLVNHGGGLALHATLANFALIAGDDSTCAPISARSAMRHWRQLSAF